MQILFILTLCLKNTYITLFILKIIFIKSINAHKNHLTNPQTNIIITRTNINKHKAKIYNHCKYTQIILKKIPFFFAEYKNEWKQHKSRLQKNQKK